MVHKEQACDEESGDADLDTFKTVPWDAGGTQRDETHEVMCRQMVHNADRLTTGNTKCVLTTKMLVDTNCPRLESTPGEGDASYRSTDWSARISQPLHWESLYRYVCNSSYVAISLTMRYISGVNRCVVFTGSEDPCCSCSWSTRGSTPFALFPPTPECMSSSSPVESSQPVRRELLRPSSDTSLVQPPDVILPLYTTRYVNAFGQGSVFRSRRRTQVVLVLSQMRGGTSAALFLRRSDARAVVYRPTKPDHLRLQKKRRRWSCCPVFLCSSPSTRDVAFGMFSPHMTTG